MGEQPRPRERPFSADRDEEAPSPAGRFRRARAPRVEARDRESGFAASIRGFHHANGWIARASEQGELARRCSLQAAVHAAFLSSGASSFQLPLPRNNAGPFRPRSSFRARALLRHTGFSFFFSAARSGLAISVFNRLALLNWPGAGRFLAERAGGEAGLGQCQETIGDRE